VINMRVACMAFVPFWLVSVSVEVLSIYLSHRFTNFCSCVVHFLCGICNNRHA